MSITSQLIIVFLLIVSAIFYFINRGQNNNRRNCDENCSQCDLYKHCKTKTEI